MQLKLTKKEVSKECVHQPHLLSPSCAPLTCAAAARWEVGLNDAEKLLVKEWRAKKAAEEEGVTTNPLQMEDDDT